MPVLEKDIEKGVVRYAEAHNWIAIKFTPKGDVGWPDHIFVKDGKTVWIEFKRPGEEPTPLQQYRMRHLRSHGALVYWVDNTTAGIAMLRSHVDD